jgi:hypothetical protein
MNTFSLHLEGIAGVVEDEEAVDGGFAVAVHLCIFFSFLASPRMPSRPDRLYEFNYGSTELL